MSKSAQETESYGAFAYAYDKALGQRFFRAVKRLIAHSLEAYPTRDRTHVDVACGTGLAMEYFASRGWRTAGVDISVPMLRMARKRAANIVAGDFRALPLRGTFSRVTCLYDSLNHMRERDDLVAAFRSMRELMHADSLLLFDMNHPDIYPEVWGMKEPFVAGARDYRLEMATSYRKRDATGKALVTGWAILPNGEKAIIRETHRQRAWSEQEIIGAVEEARMEVIEIVDFDPYNEAESLRGAGVKLFFVAKPV